MIRSVNTANRREANSATGQRWSFPVGVIAGITIRLHVTFVALVVLVALSASGNGESAVGAVGWLMALFACVVVHELSHALVARTKGIAVHEIDLLPIGGVSRLERIPEDWRSESAVAAAGPIASIAVAGLMFLAAVGAGQRLLPPSLWSGPLLVRLAWVNLMLAGFNLLPAFPLDGGRVLRALLERDHPRVDATRRAVRISRLVATAMIAVGLVANIWLLIIGVFVLTAGGAEQAAVLLHAALGPTPAGTIAAPCPVVLRADTAAGDAAVLIDQRPQVAWPVASADGAFLGLVTTEVLRRAAPDTPVGQLASGSPADAAASLEEVAQLASSGPVAITSGGVIIGVITGEMIERYLRDRLHEVGG